MAAQLMYITRSRRWGDILTIGDERIWSESDYQALAPRHASWKNRSIFQGLRSLWHLFSGDGSLQELRRAATTTSALARELQKILYTEHPLEIMYRRSLNLHGEFPWRAYAVRVLRRLSLLNKNKIPRTILLSYLRLMCNALPTSRRMGNLIKPCVFGCGTAEGDVIRHYSQCEFLRTAFLPILGPLSPLWPIRPGFRLLMVLQQLESDDLRLTALAITDVFFSVYLHCRAQPPHGQNLADQLRSRLLRLQEWAPRLRRAFLQVRMNAGLGLLH